jgi:type III restriction enzyme
MALYPQFPESPYAQQIPSQRRFPADQTLRTTSYEKLPPPLVAKTREQLCAWRQKGYAGASATSATTYWSTIGHLWSTTSSEIAGRQMLNLRRMGDAAASDAVQ